MELPVEAIIRFARLLATTPSSAEVRALLIRTVGEITGAAAALVQLDPSGAPVVSAHHAFDEASSFALAGVDHDDVGKRFLEEGGGGRFGSAVQLPLVADGGLYGFVVLLLPRDAAAIDDAALKLAGALADLTATTLARTAEHDELEKAYRDLSESRRALGQAEKLRAVGAMAAGVAHDLKNVFTPLLLHLDLMADDASTDTVEEMRACCRELKRPLLNGLTIVERLRSFSRFGRDEPVELAELHTVVDDAVGLCRPRAVHNRAAVHIDVSAAPDTPIVRVDVVEVVAALTNLIVNAIDAVGAGGGTVRVSTKKDGDGAAVEVADDGPGMADDVKARIFEPFFTTKGKAGTGLGLPMVKEMAQRHGGRLTLDSSPGHGARFTLWFPQAVVA